MLSNKLSSNLVNPKLFHTFIWFHLFLAHVFKKKINKIAKQHGLQLTNIGYVKNGKNGQVTSNDRPINIDAYKHF